MNRNLWQRDFERLLNNKEAKSVKDFFNYYRAESEKAIEIFKIRGSLTANDLIGVFTADGYKKRYQDLYENIGISFANWYAKNNEKYISKQFELERQQETWRELFRSTGLLIAEQRVAGVQNTAKANLISVLRKLMQDPDFQTEGEEVKARMLRRQYNHYSAFQARRLVRTEATNAANFATMESAKSVYAGVDMQKEWITSMDGREREWHGAANGQIVDFENDFIVDGQSISRPGQGSARNVINCRCSMAPFPKEGANTLDQFEGIGFGLGKSMQKAERSYNDYPEAVVNNAKRGIKLNEAVNNRCATDVGKQRAQQLAKREKLSIKTIKRMYSYLSRAAEYYDPADTEACGTISYLLWGGKAALRWSRGKLKELGEIE